MSELEDRLRLTIVLASLATTQLHFHLLVCTKNGVCHHSCDQSCKVLKMADKWDLSWEINTDLTPDEKVKTDES